MINKILALIFGILFLITAVIAFFLNWQKQNLEKELIECKSTIFIQNEAIKQNALDLENFKNAQPSIEKQIETKYQKVVIKDTSCEEERESIKALLGTFFAKE